jgi:S1-C subfamily serine protease
MVKGKPKWVVRIVVGVLVAVLTLVILALLSRWTTSIAEVKRKKELRATLQGIVERDGVEGVLRLSDLEVSNIFYGEEGLSILIGDESTWTYSSAEMVNISVYERVNRSVVHITTTSEAPLGVLMDTQPAVGTGSGIILSSDGYILTNAHVVEKATSLKVGLWDGTTHDAHLVGLDSEDDIAVIKINGNGKLELQPVRIGDSEALKIGQQVIAIGNPFGYDRTMTTGVVSGLNRPIRSSDGKIIMNAIQTDATINPGNSGGPLLNSRGEVVGINTSIYSMTGSSQGLGFAIPISTAVMVIPDLIKSGKVSRGWIDIAAVQLTPQLVSYAKLPLDKGVLISQVASGGNAEKAGLQGGSRRVQYGSSVLYLGGDIITEIGGVAVQDLNDLYLALLPMRANQKVEVVINRNGETKRVVVQLIERTAQHVGALVR